MHSLAGAYLVKGGNNFSALPGFFFVFHFLPSFCSMISASSTSSVDQLLIPMSSFQLVSLSHLPLFLNGLLTLASMCSAADLLNRLEDRLDDISPLVISTSQIGAVTRRSFKRIKRLWFLVFLASFASTYVFFQRFRASLESGKLILI